ncbi:MAG: hypothetical protein ACW977_14490, partial [Candidatus Thorarchaeota archaeon]
MQGQEGYEDLVMVFPPTINGVLLTQFSFILMTMRGVTQDGVGDELGLRFSSDGGATWLSGATSYRSSDVNASGAAVASADYAAIGAAVSFADVSVWITDMNVPIPTGLISNEMVAGAGFTSRRSSMTWEAAEVHDGIHNRPSGVALMARQTTTQSHDFAATPQATWVVDIPAGHTVVDIVAVECGVSVSGNIIARPSVGGTVAEIDMRLMYANHITSRVLNQAFAVGDGIRITEVGTTGLTGKCSAWNMNTAAPLTAFGQTFHGNVWQFGQVFQSIAPYNQFVISVNGGGTINAGTVYVQSYKRTNVVEPYDFTASPVTEWDLT